MSPKTTAQAPLTRLQKAKKFLTNSVFIFSLIGIVLIILAGMEIGKGIPPFFLTSESAIYSIVKSIGAALLGSGVFTAIIKSNEYTEIFSGIIEDIIGSKDFIAKRNDKREFWNTVSTLLYEEKFPAISKDLNDIIANHYLPVTSDFYLDDYDLFLNITDVSENFRKHEETIKFTLRPLNAGAAITYITKSTIDLPKNGIPDQTDLRITEITENEKPLNIKVPQNSRDSDFLTNTLSLPFSGKSEYKVCIKRTKIVCKLANPDRRLFAPSIINNMSITLIIPNNGITADLHPMGTIYDFIEEQDQVNNGSRVKKWVYKGLILPRQGNIILFK